MKILTKFKRIVISALTFVALVCFGAGCDFTTVEDIKKDYGVSVEIVYYANGGNIDGNVTKRTLYYKAGDKALDLGNTEDVKVTSGSTSEVKRSGYDFIGWYKVTLVDGSPVFYDAVQENGFFEKGARSERTSDMDFAENERFFVDYDVNAPMDFSQRLDGEQKIYLCAHWEKSEMLDVRPLCVDVNGQESVLVVDGKTYSKEETIFQDTYSSDGSVFVSESEVPKFAGYTVLEFVDENGEKIDWSTVKRTGTGVNQFVYAKYLVGEWTLLKTSSDVVNMLKGGNSENYYLLNDIDCAGTKINVSSNATFAGVLFGNGKTISNLSVSASSYVMNGNYSIFGKISSEASLQDFTLKNVNVEFKGSRSVQSAFSVNYFCSSVETGATIENVEIDDGSFSVEFNNATIVNIDLNAEQAVWLGTDCLTILNPPTFSFKEKSE